MSEKTRIHTRIDADTERKITAAMPLAHCRSQNEFVEKALNFYCDYLTTGDCTSVLPPIYRSALKATIKATEERISRLMFKQLMEMDMMMNVLAAGMEISEDTLRALRGRCVQNVKKTNASFTMDTYTHVTPDMQRAASDIVGGFLENLLGKELRPWQTGERAAPAL